MREPLPNVDANHVSGMLANAAHVVERMRKLPGKIPAFQGQGVMDIDQELVSVDFFTAAGG